ncbi:oligopeptide transport system substrate-binding protein [Mycoplasma testudineum]|uniref:Oligopeptide transport system substrate-binding protein n=1 Tax=Mycoplasma testudineum TaxID=244584 RepID=A0A4R6IC15_9MOLU|nr:ABC transporter substrate-binding protein [Mycoplasma testudineum]OYD26531.1 hypothetical protein CG473_03385 [Mycoplasma testudineum]TDO19131.1 oligopeptide transport system substrate-binding protein [Mycoplasma testudineum]
MIFRKKSLILGALSIASIATLATIAACNSVNPSTEVVKNRTNNGLTYDVGLSTAPLNNLNYLKNKNTFIIMPSFIEGFMKSGTTDKVKNLIGMPTLNLAISTIDVNNLDNYVHPSNIQDLQGRFYPFSNFNYTVGVGAATTSDEASSIALMSSTNDVYSFKLRMNDGQSTWSTANENAPGNNDPVTPQDFIDAAQYILDLNTGSQLLVDFLNLNIKNSQAIVDAQNEYIKIHKKPYLDPFGRKSIDENGNEVEIDFYKPGSWESQSENDEKEVAAIKAAVEGFGIYTGDFGPVDLNTLPSGRNLEEFLKKPTNRYADPRQTWEFDSDDNIVGTKAAYAQDKWQLRYEFEQNNPINFFSFANALSESRLKPISRKFVESVGGIQLFGSSKETFIWNGPFDPETVALGDGGFIILTKREKYYSSSKTMVNRIKIFFQTQQTVNASLFNDGHISQTNIPTEYIYQFWANKDTRKLMNKKTGFGTIAIQINADKETNRQPALLDSDFRSALWYAMNREEALKLVGLDTSFPVSVWTGFGNAKNSRGVALEQYFENVKVTSKDGKKFPLQIIPYQDNLAKGFTFENVDRSDNNFDLETARFYLDLYKRKNPNVSQVRLQYVYDSSDIGIKAGISIQDAIKKAFGDYVVIDIKGYPANVFEQYSAEGKFDLTFKNFDYFGTEYDSYIKTFFFSDGIEINNQKTTGFRTNPAGSWTYRTYFDELASENIDEETRVRLEVEKYQWDKIKELSTQKDSETTQQFKDRVNSFFAFQFSDEEKAAGWNEHENFKLITVYEKIVKDAVPVIPMMEIDTQWEITRLGGVSSTYTYSLQFAYDLNYPPIPGLPTTRE